MKKLLSFFLIVILLTSCSKDVSVGKDLPANKPVVTLKELLDDPGKYHTKEILLKGTVEGQCGNKCDFTYAEKGTSHTIYVGDLDIPAIKAGTPIMVTANVHSGEKKLILTATGLKLESKGGK